MVSSLYWRPTEDYGHSIDSDLKFILRERYGNPINIILTNHDLDYLSGMEDSGIKNVNKLILAIRKHGSIRLKEVY